MMCTDPSRDLDPYTVLGLSTAATPAEVTQAFRVRLRALHPDTRTAPPDADGDDGTQLQHLLTAYVQLRRLVHRAGKAGG